MTIRNLSFIEGRKIKRVECDGSKVYIVLAKHGRAAEAVITTRLDSLFDASGNYFVDNVGNVQPETRDLLQR